ncbi:unnamed protein product [Microthlaspi erraticum]|uniref:AMP-dependent synthetase/ligase domain-containing protein n=1 Tax=Microthlaspi erraticum TaxID=1685480 RepID=A0A6D2IGX5_9BRAS|nr:unnamed protein product [Microthlaspi erraticum]
MDLEELTSKAKQIQEEMLEEILRVNANTEYLRRFLHGSTDKELFKKNVPVITYEDVKPYIERVANGEPSNRTFRHFKGVEDGKVLAFLNTRPLYKILSGIPVAPVITSFIMTDYFKNWSSKCYASPDQVILCTDNNQSIYCHLLCALVQREEIVSIFAPFASTVIQAIKFLENIRSGDLSEWITDRGCRDSVSVILRGPNLELADVIEHECSQKSWEGMITRLWPNIKFVQSIITGQISQYIPILEYYSNKLPLISVGYSSSETLLGVNVNPLCKPQDISYTFSPNMSYLEFQEEGNNDEIVDLVNVKIGCSYEVLVTNHFGIYRYRLGDILQVTGFYNTPPQFRFVRRKNMVISVFMEVTTEDDIMKALNRARVVLESSGLMLMGFTCYSDISTIPGHYDFYWELKAKNFEGIVKLGNKVMVKCCCVMEESFNALYRGFRNKNDSIGALEIRVVQEGTFDYLMEHFISEGGASASQYKTPICTNSPEVLAILEDRVVARFFSDKTPPL